MLIGYIPIAKFKEKNEQGILSARLYHLCLDIVTESLKKSSRTPVDMTDCYGKKRKLRTPLVAFLADRPEQLLIACAAGNASPLSMADTKSFGNADPCPLRRGPATLETIADLLAHVDPSNLQELREMAKVVGLNGVTRPFWRDWEFADPCEFLTPDALHQWHKAFMDHLIEWAKTIIGKDELDKRLSVLQPRVGFRHFADGFTRFKQHTGVSN